MDHKPIFAVANTALLHAERTASEWAAAMRSDTLHVIPSFEAYTALPNLGPDNDHDGVRSCAMKLKLELDVLVLGPAQQEKQALAKETRLLWTKCWRSGYAQAAAAFGYQCSWNSGSLSIRKPGRWTVSVTPASREFLMSDLIAEARRKADAMISKEEKKAQDEYQTRQDRISENLARAAAGEPIFLLKSKRTPHTDIGTFGRRNNSWLGASMAAAVLGSLATPYFPPPARMALARGNDGIPSRKVR